LFDLEVPKSIMSPRHPGIPYQQKMEKSH